MTNSMGGFRPTLIRRGTSACAEDHLEKINIKNLVTFYMCLCSYTKSKIIWKSKFGYCVGKLFHPTEDHHVELYESGILGITDCISNIAQDIFKKVQVNPLDHTAECVIIC